MHTEEKNEQNIRQQEAVHRLHECCTEENLWRCIVEFQNTRMWTASGLPFQYKLKVGRNGRFTKELWVDRREDSKSLAWSSVKLAFRFLYDTEDETGQENANQEAADCTETINLTDYTGHIDQAEGARTQKYHYNKKLVLRPKALGDIRGISYIYALFYRFGLIEVPEKSREKMNQEHV